ncbi:MAG: hypothetical protein JRN61_01930 [Nitrososphaerota archaeon]|nr:hypothetical protein [Nitrososphaerota archaeon]
MTDRTWKAVERRVARMFGSERNPLSGSSSRHTQADVIHDHLYIEVKHRAKIPFYTVWQDTMTKAAQEGKVPIVIFHEKGSDQYIAMVDAKFLAEVVRK